MKSIFILMSFSFLVACATQKSVMKDGGRADEAQEVIITGRKIDRSETPPGPKLAMKLKPKAGTGSFIEVFKFMQSLPQPKDIGDCNGLLAALPKSGLNVTIVNSNLVAVETNKGLYEYSFDDSSCPVD